MVIKAWGPLFALLALAGIGVIGLMVEHSEPHNRSQPAVTPCKDSPMGIAVAPPTDSQNGKEGKQESSWIKSIFDKPTDTLLLVFNALLALFTGLLYRATAGLFKETAGMRSAADQQALDMKDAIKASRDTANTAMLALGSDRAWISLEEISCGFLHNCMVGEVIVTNGISFCARWVNRGRSPALKCQIWIKKEDIDFADQTVPVFTPDWAEVTATYPIGPGAPANSSFVRYLDKETKALYDGKIAIVIYSACRYIDVFNSNVVHLSEICIRISDRGGVEVSPDGIQRKSFEYMAFGPQNTST